MMFAPLSSDTPRDFGLDPKSWGARDGAGVIVYAAGATSDRATRYRGAGMGRGGYAP